MSADLRQKLEALADRLEQSMDHVTGPLSEWQKGFDFARTDTVKQLRDLLASHEEREGDGWKDAAVQVGAEAYDHRARLEKIAEAMWPEDVAENGYPSMAAVAREAVRHLRSHTDRESDGIDGYAWQTPEHFNDDDWREFSFSTRPPVLPSGDEYHATLRIGPSVQPEEES